MRLLHQRAFSIPGPSNEQQNMNSTKIVSLCKLFEVIAAGRCRYNYCWKADDVQCKALTI